MSSESTLQTDWTQLSSEPLGSIFALVEKDSTAHYEDICQAVNRWNWLSTLQRVCKRFHSVYKEQPLLYRSLILLNQPEVSRSPYLLKLLDRYRGGLQILSVACGSPWLEMVLTALQLHKKTMCVADVWQASTASLYLLSTFHTLSECKLQAPESEVVSLQALQVLPHLTTLTLEHGHFAHVNVVAHLSSLRLDYKAEVTCSQDCECVTSLLHLHVIRSQLKRFHTKGVSACCNLQTLKCIHGQVSAVSLEEDFQWDETRVNTGSSLTALTALTMLEIGDHNLDVDVDLGWVTMLKSLKSLEARSKVRTVELPGSLSSLNSLSSLLVGSSDTQRGVVTIDFDWAGLVSLQRVVFVGTIQLSHVTSLIALPTLQQVTLQTARNIIGYTTTKQMFELVYSLGRDRPDVLLQLI